MVHIFGKNKICIPEIKQVYCLYNFKLKNMQNSIIMSFIGMNPRIRILPLPRANGLPGGQMSR